VARSATADQIRSAYRKLVLQHHPDRSKDPASKVIFLSITESYEILSSPEERHRYDERLKQQAERAATAKQPPPRNPPRAAAPRPAGSAQKSTGGRESDGDSRVGSATATVPSVAEEIQRLTKLYQTGRQAEAETKARAILKRDSRQPMPYAILGDIARGRGNINEAAKMYAFAMQMDPRNALYERRYREILNRASVVSDPRKTRLEPEDKKVIIPMIGGAIVILSAIYLGLSQEEPLFRWIPPVSTWTVSSLVSMFIAGVTVGASLSVGNLVDRYSEMSVTSTGRFSPSMALGCASMVQFWFAAALYGAIGLVQRAWNYSTTRLIIGVAAATLAMSLAACLNVSVNPVQILFWGGNVIYVGALIGWIIADAFR
jgi:curved DNA-binding protein CbpA